MRKSSAKGLIMQEYLLCWGGGASKMAVCVNGELMDVE